MLERVNWAVARTLVLLAEAADQVLGLGGHARRNLDLFEVFHDLFHLELVHALFPDGVPARQQVEHDDARRPDVRLLGVGENVRHLLGWFV